MTKVITDSLAWWGGWLGGGWGTKDVKQIAEKRVILFSSYNKHFK